jgi:hypothetical protein
MARLLPRFVVVVVAVSTFLGTIGFVTPVAASAAAYTNDNSWTLGRSEEPDLHTVARRVMAWPEGW